MRCFFNLVSARRFAAHAQQSRPSPLPVGRISEGDGRRDGSKEFCLFNVPTRSDRSSIMRRPYSFVPISLSELEVKLCAFSIDQNEAGIQDLLPGAIVPGIASQARQGQEVFDRFRATLLSLLDSGAEHDALEIGRLLKMSQDRPNEMRDVVVECQCREFVM